MTPAEYAQMRERCRIAAAKLRAVEYVPAYRTPRPGRTALLWLVRIIGMAALAWALPYLVKACTWPGWFQ